MKKQILSAFATATLLAALAPAAMAQNVAIVNGKAIPKARVDALAEQMHLRTCGLGIEQPVQVQFSPSNVLIGTPL